MIPVKNRMTQETSIDEDEIEFGIGDPRWVMRNQADLYSNRELAVAREYSTNAYDAGKERALRLGLPIPAIEVTLPGSLDRGPFIVRDFGDGMDRETLTKVYTQFGVSSKRNSNEFNGMLGYGCKSAVAYTNTFTVTSVHNGIKTEALITRKPDWRIVMKIVSEKQTFEPSGTTVRVPVHNPQEFEKKARDFYRFWLPGTVKINGVEPAHEVGGKITDGLYYAKDKSWNTSYVVMGNVPYRIENPQALFRDSRIGQINFVAYVDTVVDKDGNKVAAVEFTPSREDLKYTDHTKATLHKIIADFEKRIIDTAQAEISNAKTHAEAYQSWAKWTKTINKSLFASLEFKGEKFRSDFEIIGHRYQTTHTYGRATQFIRQWGVESMDKTMVVTECSVSMSTMVKSKAKQYAGIKGWPDTYIIFTTAAEKDIKSPWIDRSHFVTWEDLKAAIPKKPIVRGRQDGRPSRISGTFDFITKNGFEREKVLPDTVDNVTWISLQASKYTQVVHILGLIEGENTVIILPKNREAKFRRENPTVKPFMEWAKAQVVKDGPSLLTDEGKEVRAIPVDTRRWVRALDTARVDDPDFAKMKSLVAKEESLVRAYNRNLGLAQSVGMRYDVVEHKVKMQDSLVTRYPLLGLIGYNRVQPHVYLYMNAAFAAIKEKKK